MWKELEINIYKVCYALDFSKSSFQKVLMYISSEMTV